MNTGREQYLQALAGLRETTRTQAERVARLLAKQGEVQVGQASRAAEDLLRRTRKNREQLSRLLQREVKRQLGAVGIATREEVARLQQRVRAREKVARLQQRVRALEQAAERSSRPAGAGRRPASPRTAASGTARSSTRPAGSSNGPSPRRRWRRWRWSPTEQRRTRACWTSCSQRRGIEPSSTPTTASSATTAG